MVISVLAIHVVKQKYATAGRNYEKTAVEVQNYFITPEDIVGGQSVNRMTFLEAINRMVF